MWLCSSEFITCHGNYQDKRSSTKCTINCLFCYFLFLYCLLRFMLIAYACRDSLFICVNAAWLGLWMHFPSRLYYFVSPPGWRTLSSSFGGKRKSSSIFIKEACLVMLKCSAHTHTFLLIEMSAFYFKFDPFIYTFFICIISSGSWHHTLGIPALAYNSTVRTFG